MNEVGAFQRILQEPMVAWGRKWQPTPGLLPGKSHGRRSLVGYKELDTTVRLSLHIVAWIGEVGDGQAHRIQIVLRIQN